MPGVRRPEEGTQFHGTRVMDGCKLSCGLESKPRSLIEALSALNYWAIFKYEISSWALAEAYTVCGHTCNPPDSEEHLLVP